MHTHPYISTAIARDRQRDLQARAERHDLARQAVHVSGPGRRAGRTRPAGLMSRLVARFATQS